MSGDFNEFVTTRLRAKLDAMGDLAEMLIAEVSGYMAADHREKCGGRSDLDDYGFSECTHEVCASSRKGLERWRTRLEKTWGDERATLPPTAAAGTTEPKRQGSRLILEWPENGQVVKVNFADGLELSGWFLGYSIKRMDQEIHTCDRVDLVVVLPDDPADADRHFRDRVHELEGRRPK